MPGKQVIHGRMWPQLSRAVGKNIIIEKIILNPELILPVNPRNVRI